MLMTRCKAAGFALTAALAVMMTAPAADAGKKDNTVCFAYDQVLENADPYFNNVRLGVITSHAVWDTLIYRDPATNEYKPSLATSWKWVDSSTLEMELRQGVKFHNGDAFSADDVVTTLNFVADANNKDSAN
jgi:peptide/nickel transport system substrate-binding protein